jgi:RimJ/RimL family protein N-acetyltransferase
VAARTGFRIVWTTELGELVALEPQLAEVSAHAEGLAAGYNEPENARLMAHTEPFSPSEVVEHYRAMDAEGARPFLLFFNGALVGDADLRGFRDRAAEFAFLIAARERQGKGLGTRLALMIHAFAFTTLGLERVYASISPENRASRRVFEKLGYTVDDGPKARSFADEPEDVMMGIDRTTFLRVNGGVVASIAIQRRS